MPALTSDWPAMFSRHLRCWICGVEFPDPFLSCSTLVAPGLPASRPRLSPTWSAIGTVGRLPSTPLSAINVRARPSLQTRETDSGRTWTVSRTGPSRSQTLCRVSQVRDILSKFLKLFLLCCCSSSTMFTVINRIWPTKNEAREKNTET